MSGYTGAYGAQLHRRGDPGACEGWYWGVLCLAMFGYLFVNMDNGARFPVRDVRIEGHLRYLDSADIQQRIAPLLEDGFFGTDLESVRDRIAAEAWVRNVTVRRLWPHSLHIKVTEEQPLVRWGAQGFISRTGTLVELPSAFDDPSLPLLKGPPGTHAESLRRYLKFNQIMAPHHVRIRALSMDERGGGKVLLDNGWLLVLGSEDAEERFRRFARYAYSVLAPQAESVWAVDMRYANGYAVRWRDDDVGPYTEATVQR